MRERNVLVVDDNKDFADVFCDILRTNNFNVECCYSGSTAIEYIKTNDCDIVFLDIRMPDQDGIETLKKIKKIRPEVSVIMMTGYSVDESVNKVIESEAAKVVYKPFEMNKVLSLIKSTP